MAVAATDVQHRYSGGTGNTDPNASLGGAMSTAGGGVVDNAVKHDLFDAVTPAEALAGDTEYRGILIKNNHATDPLTDARVYITAQPSIGEIDVALADEAVTTAIETIASEAAAPVGPTFTHPTTYSGGLALNSTTGLVAQAYKGVWVRRSITAAAPSGSITNNLKVEGTTS